MKLNDQLKETEKELEILIQSKKSDLATTSRTIIPTISTIVPSTLEASLALVRRPSVSITVPYCEEALSNLYWAVMLSSEPCSLCAAMAFPVSVE